MAGAPAPGITWGHSKDHRPDLKQLVFILTVTGDHAVPVICGLADGNTNDGFRPTSPPGRAPVKLTGGPGFLYVADCRASLGGGDGPHRPGRRPVHHRAAAQPQGRRRVPRLDAGPPAGLGRSSPRARPDRRAGPGLVRLPGAVALRGGIPRRVDPRQRQAAPRRRRPRPQDQEGRAGDRGSAWPGGCPPRAPGCAPPPRSTPPPRPPSPTPARPAGSASPSPARPGSRF